MVKFCFFIYKNLFHTQNATKTVHNVWKHNWNHHFVANVHFNYDMAKFKLTQNENSVILLKIILKKNWKWVDDYGK